MKIVFFGTSSFAARILATLIQHEHNIVAIVTRPDRTKGRHLQLSPPPVKEIAQQLKPSIPILQPEKASTPEFASHLQTLNADLFVVVAYGEIIKKSLLEMPTLGCINIHPSLLPKYRGADPIRPCIMAGEKETGVSIIEMSPQMDAGDIIAQKIVPLPHDLTFGELENQLCEMSGTMLLEVIEQFAKGTVKKTPQDHTLATFTKKLMPADEQLDWKRSAEALYNQIRALSPAPGAWCTILIDSSIKRLKIKKAALADGSGTSGEILSFGKTGWIIACEQGALRLIEVQLEGKKTMSAEECARGMRVPKMIV